MKQSTIGDGLNKLIAKAGNTIGVLGTDKSWKALIQPLRYRNKLYVEESAEPPGMINRTAYLYIGSKENDLRVYPRGTLFLCDGELLTLTHCELTRLSDKSEYVWAVLSFYSLAETPAGRRQF